MYCGYTNNFCVRIIKLFGSIEFKPVEATDMDMSTWINAGRSTMKAEILSQIVDLMEDAARHKNDKLIATLHWFHDIVAQMPARIEDKPQQKI